MVWKVSFGTESAGRGVIPVGETGGSDKSVGR